MPPRAFTLQIPAEAKYADVAADAARTFVELLGGGAAEAAAFAEAVVDAFHGRARAGEPMTCAFSVQDSGVEAAVSGGEGSPAVVRQPIATK